MRQSQFLLAPRLLVSCTRSSQVAVSPCLKWNLPDVISTYLSPRAWIPTPDALKLHSSVTSLETSAFPETPTGRRYSIPRTIAISLRNTFRGCNHSITFRPAGLLATHIAPTAAFAGQTWLLLLRIYRFVTSPSRRYTNRPYRTTDGKRTFTSQDWWPYRPLRCPFVLAGFRQRCVDSRTCFEGRFSLPCPAAQRGYLPASGKR